MSLDQENSDRFVELGVLPAHDGMRLDAFLAARHGKLSRSAYARLIRNGKAHVDGEKAKPSTTVKPGQTVLFQIPRPAEVKALPQNLELEILFQDAFVVVVSKPPGMVVHPSPGHPDQTLVNALLYHCTDLSGIGGEIRPGIVHRLDKDTTGALIAAKNDQAHTSLSGQFAERKIKKKYLALVHGVPEADSGSVDLPIKRHSTHRKRMTAADPTGREALTDWKVRERFEDAALVELYLHTGRTHQIRVHLNALGHPIIGDPVYTGRKRRGRWPQSIQGKLPQPQRQMLHAWKLGFFHPQTKEFLEFTAGLPRDMEAAVEAFRETA